MHLEPAPPLAAAPAPDDTAPRRRNYVIRHWRGELSLPVAYWVNVALFGVAAALLAAAAQSTLLELRDPRPVAAVGLVLILAGVTVPVWQIVGVWRSAGRHKARGGSGFWAGAARVLMVINGLGVVVAVLRDGAPQLPVFYAMIMGEPGAKHEVSLMDNGSDALFSGVIGFGLTAEIEALLDAHPEVKVLHLSSRGGRIMEARRLHDAIRRRGLTTVSATLCASACTIAFLGGKERVITSEAKIGFHRGMIAGGTVAELSLIESADKRMMAQDGVDRAFIERASATPNSEAWYPSADEMLRAHFVTRVIRSAAPVAAGAAEPDAAGRLGFFGRWAAADCRAPASRANAIITLTRDGKGGHYHSSYGGNPPDFDAPILEIRQSGEHELTYSLTVHGGTTYLVVMLSAGQMHTLQSYNASGQLMINDGIVTGNGKPSGSFQKCD